MSALFNSYTNPVNPNQVFCDITSARMECAEPNTRMLCTELEISCANGTSGCGPLVVGNGLVLCECSDSWNCNLCGNDTPFFVPYVDGDLYTFQFQQQIKVKEITPTLGWTYPGLESPYETGVCSFEIFSCCNDKPLRVSEWGLFKTIVAQGYVGSFEQTGYNGESITVPIQQLQLDLGAIFEAMQNQGIQDDCFYFKFCFATRADALPIGAQICFCSEPFKRVPCENKNPGVVVSSLYGNQDCFGLYYGTQATANWGTVFQYENTIRVPAAFEQTNFQLTKTIIETSNKTTGSQVCENWALNSYGLPQRFVKLLATIFAGANVQVDGVEYQTQGEIAKNNEIGTRWFIEQNFEHCECSNNLTCY